MEVSMSLNALAQLPLKKNTGRLEEVGLARHSLFNSRTPKRGMVLVVEAKGKKGMAARQYQRTPPPMPKIEDDGNPRFVIFIRMANVYLWYPLSIIAGGTTAKIMVAAKDNLLGKYIYKDTIARNIAAVIYRDEKEIQKTAIKQHRVLRTATDFRYGYKLQTCCNASLFHLFLFLLQPLFFTYHVCQENGNMRAALSTSDVIELPTPDQLKTVLDKVKDFFGDAKESFGKISSLNPGTDEESPDEKAKQV